MNAATVCAFDEDGELAACVAELAGLHFAAIGLHRFPDGETLVRAPVAGDTAILVQRLHNPDAKLMPMLLAGDALRRQGARRLVLAAPYLPYMRQDRVFNAGEPLSRDVFGRLVGERFDDIITIAPHLHRTASLTTVFRPARALVLSAAETLVRLAPWPRNAVAVGPDGESGPWVREAARLVAADWTVCAKARAGDREVAVSLEDATLLRGRPVVLLDDIASTGETLIAAALAARAAGATHVEARVVHAFLDGPARQRLREAGVDPVLVTDSTQTEGHRASVAPPLARALFKLGLALS
jgi:ribose-phosphate pyrophosphokinase